MLSQIFTGQLFTSTALLALFTYLGYQLKGVPEIIYKQIKKRLIYSVHIEEGTQLFTYFEQWLLVNHEKCFKNVKATTIADNSEEKLIFLHYSDIFILKYKNKRLLITKGREKFDNANDFRSAFYNHFNIEGWFAKKIIKELLTEVLEYNKSLIQTKQYIYTNNNFNTWEYFGDVYGKSIDNVIIKEKQKIIDDILDFSSKESWYIKRGLSYKRGYLLYGPPGNGKTSFCLALANRFNKNIFFLNLNDIGKDNSLFTTFKNIGMNSILVIEDVDAIYGNRDGKSRISFSALLNCMDGAFSKHGVITILTTNHIEKLDKALIREGRIDIKMHIDNPDKNLIEEYLTIFYNKEVKLDRYEKSLSMSKVQELCLLNKNNLQTTLKTLNKTSKKEENVLA